jgi:hypothetical protein
MLAAMLKLYSLRGTLRSALAYSTAVFAALFLSLNVSADDCCDVDLPNLSADNGCAVVDTDPVGQCGDEVEWMWAQNVNGSIYAVTGWSTNQDQSFCPDESGLFRICARVVGCGNIIESNDVYVNATPNCTAEITGVYIYDQSTDAPAAGLPALANGVEIDLNQLPAEYYIAVEVSGGEQSVVLTLNGNSNTENIIPYTTPGGAENGGNLNLTAGSYSIDAAAYQNDNASGALCDEVHIDFSIVSDECATVSNGSSPYPSDDPIFQQVIADDSYCCYTWWDDTCEDSYIEHATTGELDETCVLDGYQYPSGRIFWLPGFGTDFKASGDGLFFDKFDDGTARIYGTVERIADSNKKFEVSIWFHNLSTYNEWIAQGGEAKSPELGDETSWIFYSQDLSKTSYLKGIHGLNGELLYILPQNNNYGLQIGDGANDLNANANGMSMWFDYEGTTEGHGDINATYDCQEDPLPSVNTFSLDCEDALKVAIEGVGMEGQNCADLDISYDEGTVEYIILEAVWKGWGAPSTITFTADGNEYTAAAQSVLEGNGNDQGNKRAYRVEVPAASNVGVCVPNGFNNNLRSFVAYTFRSNAGSVSAGSGEFVGRHLYNDSYTMTLTVPAADAPRDIVVTMPISDMSEDGRFADFNVTAGPVNKQYAVTGNTNGLSLNIVPFVLEDVPGDVTEVVIDLISDPNRNPNPSSFLAAGLAIADAQCDTPEEESVCEVIGFNGPGTRHFIFFNAFGTNYTSGPEGLSFIRYADGTAKMTGEIYAINNPNKIFDVVLYFENESTYDEFVAVGGEAKLENGATLADAQDWTYYVFDQDRPNVLTGRGELEGEYLFFRQMDGMPYGLQVGSNGANGKNDEFGLSTWFSYSGTSEGDGDINANLLCAEPVCEVQCPEDLELDCESATHPDFTGYPTLICAENAGCVREAGEFDFEFQGWGGSTDGWSFGPGWDVGTGCDPACGDIPNVFIDFTNFHTAYNTKLKSPMYDACCTDEVSLSFCMQQDLYGGEDVPGMLKVQYRVNGGNWITLETFESEYGTTINYERDYVLDGAAGNSFEVRFKAFGDGSNYYTMGGWGIDDVRVYGQTAGCSAGEEEVSVDWTFTDASNGSCPEVITRTFTATYQGENVECVQTLTLIDDTAPIFNEVPGDITYACASDVAASSASALDNCSDEVTVTSEDIVNGSGCFYTIDRIFTATDACGNTATYTQVITINDDQAPVFTYVPENISGSCGDVFGEELATAVDNCTGVTVTYEDVYNEFSELNCGQFRTQTPGGWGAPANGNNPGVYRDANFAAAFPNGLSIGCDNTLTLTSAAAVEAFLPSGGSPSALPNGALVDPADYNNSFAGHLVAAKLSLGFDMYDPNFSDAEAPFGGLIVNNGPFTGMTVAEVIAAADEVIGGCSNAYSPSDLTNVLTLINENYVDGNSDNGNLNCNNEELCGFFIVRTFTATDECGNTSIATQCFMVTDEEAPVLVGVPEDATVECDDVPAAAEVTAEDDCATNLEVIFTEETNTIDACTYEIIRTWTVADDCENIATATQVLTVTDTTDPVATGVPADVTIECDQPEPTDMPVFTDNCDDELEVTAASSISPADCGFIIQRSWTATDDCGNSITVSQTVTVLDTTAPVATEVPADVTIECDQPEPTDMPVFTDNCDDELEVTAASSISVADCGFIIQRSWTATDDCGNATTVSQTITVVDTVAPVFAAEAADATVECDNIPAAPALSATDICDDNVEVVLTESINPVDDCIYEIIRTWTATDDCGNTAIETQTLTVIDTTAPVLSGEDAEITIECDMAVDLPEITATDNCDDNVVVELTTATIDGVCPQSFTEIYTWTATDNCGNQAVRILTVNYEDTTAPILIGVPAEATIDCTDEVPNAIVAAQDNCDTDIEVSLHAETVYNDCGYEIVRTWTATDDCGNSVSQTQTLTVVDVTPPVFEECPASYVVNCDNGSSDPEFAGEPVVSDACSDFTVTFEDGMATDECPATFTRTWIATDACGNTSTCEQEITINDFGDPIIDCPADITIECTESTDPSNTGMATATDDCSVPVITYVDGPLMGDCPFTFERIFTATDACGNSSSSVQVITIIDTEAPVLSGEDAEITIECDMTADLPEITATDNCDEDVSIELTTVTIDGECPQSFTEVYTWTATDNCGNQSVRTFTVNYEDTTAPILIGVPADATIDCTDEVPNAIVAAQDNCDNNVEVSLTAETVYSDCGYEIVRTWSATDDCGNSVSQTQVLTVIDTTPPVFEECPAPYVVNCDNGSSDPEFAGEPVVSDACSEFSVTFQDGVATDECPATFTRTWIATDACGNTSTCEQEITINDFTAPEITCPADITIECTDSIEPANTGMATATDDCSEPMISYEDSAMMGDCPYTIERTWTAIDPCGNASSCVQIITIVDTEAPVLSGEDAEITIECDMTADLPEITATDNCDEDVSIELTTVTIAGECPQSFTEVYTWTATDNCGNQSARTFTVNYEDTTAPILIGVPADATIDCTDEVPNAIVAAQDNCDNNVEVSLTAETVYSDCGYEIVRTWSATDDCGNTVSQTQVLTVIDTTPPVFEECPAPYVVNCDNGSSDPEFAGEPVVSDACSEFTVAFQDGVATDECPATFTRTWIATDACGNTSTCEQEITINDFGDPIIDCPADITIECTESTDPSNTGMATATDDCSVPVITYVDGPIMGDCPYTFERIFTATDACGNSSSSVQVITIVDTEAPVLSGEDAEVTSECDQQVALPVVTATDNCDEDVEIIFSSELIEGDCAQSYTEVYTWVAVDECGNEAVRIFTVNYQDTTAPQLVGVPADVTAECDDVPSAAMVTAIDNCDENVEVFFSEAVEMLDCGYILTRTWSATDDCGNNSMASQVVTVVDTTDPIVVSAPEDITLECDQPEPTDMPVFADNCDDNLEITAISGINNVTDCGFTIERSWTATDDCGNSTTVSQTITFIDTTAPVLIDVPAAVTVECTAIPQAPMVSAEDNCDDAPVVTMTETLGGGCPYTITRTWIATDACGNQSTASQVITVIDEEAPVLVGVPADFVGECGDAPAADQVFATDNCDDDVPVVLTEEVIGEECPLTIIRTWTAIDNCGNTASATQTITINDTTAPIFTGGPADATVECDMVPGVDNDAIAVEDNCDLNLAISFNETIEPGEPVMEGGEPCGYTIFRTWTATDDCGNSNSFTQTITVLDTTAPDLVGVPDDVTVECTAIPAVPVVTAVDNCYDGNMVVTFEESILPADCGYQIVRTWVVEDNCWNYNSESQVITVIDTVDPIVVSTPVDVTIECDEALPTSMPVFDDACDDDLTVTMTETEQPQNCGFLVIRTWTATDDCGNSVSSSQSIFVTDTTAPVFDAEASDMDVECSNIPAAMELTATDNCDDMVEVTFSEEILPGECPYTIIRTWTATDDCGNTTIETQTLTVVDTEAPILIGVPADATVECDAIPGVDAVTATDNCDDDLEVSFADQIIANQGCGYSIVRTWTVTDNCGNTASATQTLTVVDTTAPEVVSTPADLALECDEEVPMASAQFTDNCDDDLTIGFNETVVPGVCENNFTIIRTWTAVDDCGNETSTSQNIVVSDTTAPVLVGVPADVTAECDAVPGAAQVTAADNCDPQVMVALNETISELECGYLLTRTWTATDNCGNTASASQVITVVDTTAPVAMSVPQDITIECDQQIPDAMPMFEDNCDEELEITAASSISQLECGELIERSWTVTDDCGNSITVSQTITVVDTTAPTFVSVPADATVECDAVPAPAQVVAEDNCDENLIILFEESIVEEGCPYTIERTWTVFDNCDNNTSYTQTLTVVDTTAPVLVGVPSDATVECDAVPAAATVTAEDNCADNLEVFFAESVEMLDCGYLLTRVWSTTDECGNIATATQVVTVVDTTAPVLIGVPEDVVAECDAIPAPAVVTAEDNCDTDLQVTLVEEEVEQECGYLLIRTWSVHDSCNNTASGTQVITVTDTTAPVIVNAPADIMVQCDALPGIGNVIAEDNCDPVVDITVVESTEDIACGFILTRTFTATDDCGNSSVHVQTITVEDTEAPVITGVPADVTIECGEPVPAPGQVDVTDNCDPMPVISTSEVSEDLDCGFQIVRTYIATDECGNQSTAQQIITVSDFTAPIFENVPQDAEVNCNEVTIAPTLTAIDNCDDNVEVIFSEVIGDGCPYTIERTWTAIDDCGNEASVTQTLTVTDDEAPVFEDFPFFTQVECDEVDNYMPAAFDNCDAEVEVIIVSELTFSGGCLGVLDRTYQAIDNCGNVTEANQLVQVIDVTAPELFNIPEDLELACGDEIPAPAADVFATDNCTAEVEIIFTEEQSNEFCPYTITRTWTAIDDCGNETVATQTITVTVEVDNFNVSLMAYPNPMDSRFTVEFTVPLDAQVRAGVFDMTGREVLPVFEGKADARRLYQLQYGDLDWKAGTYILMLTVDGEVYHHKIIVTQQ